MSAKEMDVLAGPTPGDTIYARKLAGFFKENPDIAAWACDKFKTPQGRSELEALMKIELSPRRAE